VKGVRAYGIKNGNNGLALIEGKGKAVGMFTYSFTGEKGMKNAEKMAEFASSSLGVDKEEVAVASTGPIGKQVDMGLIERQLGEVVKGLTSAEEGSTTAAKAIMTTDTSHKERAISIGAGNEERVVIGGIAKAIVRSPLVKSAIFGERLDLTCGRIIAAIGSSSISGDVDLGIGMGEREATAWGCDLSYDYVRINAG